MPSLGTGKILVRVPDALRLQIEDTIKARNLLSSSEPWSLSDFVRIALAEKLAKMERSRGGRGRGKLQKVVCEDVLRVR